MPTTDRQGLPQAQSMPSWIGQQIAALQALALDQLQSLWMQTHGHPAPPGLGEELLRRALAQRLQEDALGGLAPALQQRLRQLAARLQRNPDLDLAATPRIKPGTRLLRQWRGAVHLVEVLDHGFAYRGQRYGSLSAIARAITGTRWSGPVFFGLKRRSGQHHA